MIKNNTKLPTLKEIETDLFRTLQKSYSDAFTQLLTELDQIIAENRDKTRFQLKDKRFRFSIIMKFSLIGVQSGDSGGISATGEIPQERGFRDEEAHRAPHRTRPLGT